MSESNDEIIYQINYTDIQNKDILNHIYLDENTNYYLSDDFSKEFYIYLASCGFLSVSITLNNKFYLLPEMQFEYAILDFKDLIISKSLKKLLNQNNYIFKINTNINLLLEKLDSYHKDNWLKDRYKTLILDLYKFNTNSNFKILSVELYDKTSGELIAGEVGYKIGKTYTSLTGFSSKNKKYKNWGKLQMVLLCFYLQKNNFSFWNLGHPYMQYKFDLGAKVYKRIDFLKKWLKNI